MVAKWGSTAANVLVPRVENRLIGQEARFNIFMLMLFSLALLATVAGVAAIIGAFLAGMALAESTDQRISDLVHGVTELLLPFFFIGIGMHLDPHALEGRGAVALAALITVAAVLSKLIGCGLGAFSLGIPDALRVGAGMVPRGEVGMVVAQIGLSMGAVPKSVYADVVVMSIVSTLIAPPLLAVTFRNAPRSHAVEDLKLG